MLFTKFLPLYQRTPARLTPSTFDMSEALAKGTALGNLNVLSPEMRSEIFKWLLPESFQQVYSITDTGLVYAPHLSSPEPQFLFTSNALRNEMLQAQLADRACQVKISKGTVSTNFIPSPSRKQHMQADMTAMRLPRCNMLEITIVPPSPRDLERFYKVRRNVQLFVNTLNYSGRDISPPITIRLEHQDKGVLCGYNDFAMLVGPLSRLQKPCRAVMAYRTTGFHTFVPKIERRCDLIEAAIGGSREARKLLTFQQLMLDVKLPLCEFEFTLCRFEEIMRTSQQVSRWRVPEIRQPTLEAPSAARALSACCELEDWCWKYAEPEPQWLVFLMSELESSNMKPRPLLSQVFEGKKGKDMRDWAAGIMTWMNPFWDEGATSVAIDSGYGANADM